MAKTHSFSPLRDEVEQAFAIDNALFAKHDVKRGLRNADGSGVVAGLTRISQVIGGARVDAQIVPAEGRLSYRGIQIEDLVEHVIGPKHNGFEKTLFLLLVGRLPDEPELKHVHDILTASRTLSKTLQESIVTGLKGTNTMNMLQTAISALFIEDPDPNNNQIFDNFIKSIEILGKLPAIIIYSYLTATTEKPAYVDTGAEASIAESFLTMLRQGVPPSNLEASVLDLCLVLHAEHGGGNNSTFAARVVTSSGSDIYSSIVAAVGSLKGPLHGFANNMVMSMMEHIKSNLKNWKDRDEVRAYLAKIVRKEANDNSGKIYGLGHAVYTLSDPRCGVLKKKAHELAKIANRTDEYDLYLLVEELGPEVFQSIKGSDKVIAANVDFFSGFVYDCLGIPPELYTPIFAMARTAGWCAHRLEELGPNSRIIRPAYKYVS